MFVEVSFAERFGKVSFAERQSRMSIDQTNRYCSNLRDSCLGVLKAAIFSKVEAGHPYQLQRFVLLIWCISTTDPRLIINTRGN